VDKDTVANRKTTLPSSAPLDDVESASTDASPLRADAPPSTDASPLRADAPPSSDASPLRADAPPSSDASPLRADAPPSSDASPLRAEDQGHTPKKRGRKRKLQLPAGSVVHDVDSVDEVGVYCLFCWSCVRNLLCL
jgi:hypothetical protein